MTDLSFCLTTRRSQGSWGAPLAPGMRTPPMSQGIRVTSTPPISMMTGELCQAVISRYAASCDVRGLATTLGAGVTATAVEGAALGFGLGFGDAHVARTTPM